MSIILMEFINRKSELNYLNTLWTKNKAQLVIFYGKRRVGKTELIREFLKQKHGVYYLADKSTHKDQLADLGGRIGAYFQDPLLAEYGFQKWSDVFKYLKHKVTSPFILAIDEYPYLVESDSACGSLFQKGWDEYLKDSPIFLILCGSSIAMMESETLAYKSPLYGRRTGQIFVEPMTFDQAHLFFNELSFDQFLHVFSVVGGMPAYLAQFQVYSDLRDAIKEQILPKTTFLYNEIPFLLREELREPRLYMTILQAIAHGRHRQSEISNATGIDSRSIQKYLGVLRSLHFIERIVPVTEDKPEKSKHGLYCLSDPFVRFWFRFVAPFGSELELGNISHVMGIYENMGIHLEALVYEDYARYWITQHGSAPFTLQRVGKWWHSAEEIDVVALNTQENKILFGEVKWSENPVGTDILESLKEKAKKVMWGKPKRKEYFILFSRSGFTPQCLKQAKKEDIALIHGDKRIIV